MYHVKLSTWLWVKLSSMLVMLGCCMDTVVFYYGLAWFGHLHSYNLLKVQHQLRNVYM